MKTYTFYKTGSSNWFIDLPDWEGSTADLAMVQGADQMLEYMAEGEDKINLIISEKHFEGSDKIVFLREATEWENGAFYKMEYYRGIHINLEMWLCDVTKFVFGDFPKEIYICKS